MTKPLCVVVGTGKGLGLSLVRRFATGGFRVAAVSRNIGHCKDSLSEIGPPSEIRGYSAEASKPDELRAALENASNWAEASPKVAIYNAAAMSRGLASSLTPSSLDDLKVTLGGAVSLSNLVIGAMRKVDVGTLMFTGGGLSIEPHPEWAVLGMGKAALRNFVGSLHRELDGTGVHACVVTICGLIEPGTDFDPDKIAEVYWQAHTSKRSDWKDEIIYMPGGDRRYNFDN